MSERAKSPVIILVALLIISLVAAGAGFFLFQKEHLNNLALQDELEEIKTRQKITESRLEEAKRILTALDGRLKDTRGQVDALNSALEEEKAAKEDALSKIEALRSELEEQKGLRGEIEEQLISAQKDMKLAQDQLNDLQVQKEELELKVGELEVKSADLETKMAGVELGKIVVSKDSRKKTKQEIKEERAAKQKAAKQQAANARKPAASAAKSLEGKVLVVNKDYNFAVLNLGSQDGVAVGDLFSLYHNNKYSGDLKVSKLHDSMAAADFISEDIKLIISEGDKVERKP